MKHILLDSKKKFYKANLHCHSLISDGWLTISEIKKLYMEHGYSIVAFTDHELFLPHNDLTDKNFLALNGMELSVNEPTDYWPSSKVCHFNIIAKKPDMVIHPLWHRDYYLFGHNDEYKHLQKFDETKPNYVREYSTKGINEMFKIAHKAGFFITYNHSEWSTEDYKQYSKYKGMDAYEIFNGGCSLVGYDEGDTYNYDVYLRQGKRIKCIAADDNHNQYPIDKPNSDSFLGFTMINAPKLKYESVIRALIRGNTYCSTGPKIYELSYDNETRTVHIETEACERITLHVDIRENQYRYPEENKELTSADFVISEHVKYFRVQVLKNGKMAYTNGYFVEDLK